MSGDFIRRGGRALRFWFQRFVASGRAGAWCGPFRRGARFAVVPIDQDGVLLLMPREPSFSFVFVPLLLVSCAGGAALAVLG